SIRRAHGLRRRLAIVRRSPNHAFPRPRSFVPRDQKVVTKFVNILHHDFELYFRDIQNYFRCLDEQRARVFEEAREVSEHYGRFFASPITSGRNFWDVSRGFRIR
ncbi:MAG TPA: hypothetical protein DCE85_05645, partial [Sulfitobacter sp.]|nr:hypothetical protein [Sulfitobacter sp.]